VCRPRAKGSLEGGAKVCTGRPHGSRDGIYVTIGMIVENLSSSFKKDTIGVRATVKGRTHIARQLQRAGAIDAN
jgi:hypothetical protein